MTWEIQDMVDVCKILKAKGARTEGGNVIIPETIQCTQEEADKIKKVFPGVEVTVA